MSENIVVTATAPATVANVGCGFDIMGFALSGAGDRVSLSPAGGESDSSFRICGPYGHLLPPELERNTAGAAIKAILEKSGKGDLRLSITLEKNLPLGSGLGSSASSAVAAVTALNRLLGNLYSPAELVEFAMAGEKLASGSAHADNAAPSALGGFVLIRSTNPLDLTSVKCPDDLFCAVVHPHIQIKTSDARRILRKEMPISSVVKQSANTAGFMTGLLTCDYDLIARSMSDLVAEPRRCNLIPGFEIAKSAALGAGALGFGISGSGPSVFALFRGKEKGNEITDTIQTAFVTAGLRSDIYLSSLNEEGARII